MLPLQKLSGGVTRRESVPELVENVMLAAPTCFVSAGRVILNCGPGIAVVWPQFLSIRAIGTALFFASLARIPVNAMAINRALIVVHGDLLRDDARLSDHHLHCHCVASRKRGCLCSMPAGENRGILPVRFL